MKSVVIWNELILCEKQLVDDSIKHTFFIIYNLIALRCKPAEFSHWLFYDLLLQQSPLFSHSNGISFRVIFISSFFINFARKIVTKSKTYFFLPKFVAKLYVSEVFFVSGKQDWKKMTVTKFESYEVKKRGEKMKTS